jgi:hypothetical protein
MQHQCCKLIPYTASQECSTVLNEARIWPSLEPGFRIHTFVSFQRAMIWPAYFHAYGIGSCRNKMIPTRWSDTKGSRALRNCVRALMESGIVLSLCQAATVSGSGQVGSSGRECVITKPDYQTRVATLRHRRPIIRSLRIIDSSRRANVGYRLERWNCACSIAPFRGAARNASDA